jgi:hypothetical protein
MGTKIIFKERNLLCFFFPLCFFLSQMGPIPPLGSFFFFFFFFFPCRGRDEDVPKIKAVNEPSYS